MRAGQTFPRRVGAIKWEKGFVVWGQRMGHFWAQGTTKANIPFFWSRVAFAAGLDVAWEQFAAWEPTVTSGGWRGVGPVLNPHLPRYLTPNSLGTQHLPPQVPNPHLPRCPRGGRWRGVGPVPAFAHPLGRGPPVPRPVGGGRLCTDHDHRTGPETAPSGGADWPWGAGGVQAGRGGDLRRLGPHYAEWWGSKRSCGVWEVEDGAGVERRGPFGLGRLGCLRTPSRNGHGTPIQT